MQPTIDSGLSSKIDEALEYIGRLDGAVVALSAGVDSSLVALLSRRRLGDQTIAVTGVSQSLATGELSIAQEIAKEIGIRHMTLETHEVEDPSYASNQGDRCYHCKKSLYQKLRRLATELGYEAVLDGTQTDDLNDTRPGMKAAQEAGVLSPLLHASFSKSDVRRAARAFGLAVWDKPAMPCLSSRIVTGETVTIKKLAMVDRAESCIRKKVNPRDLRVRLLPDLVARIEVAHEDRHLFISDGLMDEIDRELRGIGFSAVTLDLRGYQRSGKKVSEVLLPLSD